MTSSVELALARGVAFWNAGDLDKYLDLYDDEVRLYGYSPTPLDKPGVAARYRAVWVAMSAPGKPNPILTIEEVIVQGNRPSNRFRMKGELKGTFMGFTGRGRSYEYTGMTHMHFRGEKVIERWSLVDRAAVLQQIGAVTG